MTAKRRGGLERMQIFDACKFVELAGGDYDDLGRGMVWVPYEVGPELIPENTGGGGESR